MVGSQRKATKVARSKPQQRWMEEMDGETEGMSLKEVRSEHAQ
jgi:hypothetical protein